MCTYTMHAYTLQLAYYAMAVRIGRRLSEKRNNRKEMKRKEWRRSGERQYSAQNI